MSAILTGAVWQRGPLVVRERMLLAAITDNADDYGFACVAIETLAAKVLCTPRTIMRLLGALEREGWLLVKRKAMNGRGNLYFVNVTKLGVVLSERARMSEWHRQFLGTAAAGAAVRKATGTGDRMSRETAQRPVFTGSRAVSGDKVSRENEPAQNPVESTVDEGGSGDISGVGQVTFAADSGDISGSLYKKNVLTVRNVLTPLPPSTPEQPEEQATAKAKAKASGSEEPGVQQAAQVNPATHGESERTATATATAKATAGVNAGDELGAGDGAGAGSARAGLALVTLPPEDAARLKRQIRAAKRVCVECNLADDRTERAVLRAIRNFARRSDAEPEHVAEMMIGAYGEWAGMGAMLRYRWKPARFFSDGHWINAETWPLQQHVVDRMARSGRL